MAVLQLVYIGEDVVHGGYYLVTDGLQQQFPLRVRDFPPDETTLLGAGIGFAHTGLIPIVEIPYAKYVDCAMDMLSESAIMAWLSAGQQTNGLIIRLQGFGPGVFGGNYHTHNMLHLLPGMHVVCYSNGRDWVRGLREAVAAARQGRVVMLVDSTALLNMRHIVDGDEQWKHAYPASGSLSFEDVLVYGAGLDCTVVTYGPGVPAALQAQATLRQAGLDITVVDTPYLSRVPQALFQKLAGATRVLFADVCKAGASPLAGFLPTLQQARCLPTAWRLVASEPTYNPLGSTMTFLDSNRIALAVQQLCESEPGQN
jgi:2-oxoisovalerate dehydrogenase E1 component